MGASLRELMGEEGGEGHRRTGGETGGTTRARGKEEREEERENALRYFIETKKGEAVDLIKAAILSRPSARRNSPLKTTSGEQRYQIESSTDRGRSYESPLAGRLNELLVADVMEDGISRDMVVSS